LEGACIGVHANELHAIDIATNHMLDSIAASASDTYHLDDGLASRFLIYHFKLHNTLLNKIGFPPWITD
jgi:hypothetical protein